MATYFLPWFNDALKRVHVIQGDAGSLVTSTVTSTATGLVATGALSTLPAQQVSVDMMLQITNEVVQESYAMGLAAKIASTATISLVAQQREYSLPSDFLRMAGKTYDQRRIYSATSGLTIWEYAGGYMQMIVDQPMATSFTGMPNGYALSPGSEVIRFDREPATGQAGMSWNYIYEKQVRFTSTSEVDALPFNPIVADQLVPALAEVFNKSAKGQYDLADVRKAIARAVSLMTETRPNDRWGPQRRA